MRLYLPVRCPVPGHDRGPWLWVPYGISFTFALLAAIGGFIPWVVATPILAACACAGTVLSYYHILCHRHPERFRSYREEHEEDA